MKKLRAIGALLCAAVALAACEKNAVQTIDTPVEGARIRFFNFGFAPGSLPATSVNFFANDQKVTAVSSTTGTESATGVNFGGTVAGALYSALPAGQYTLSGRLAAADDSPDKNRVISSASASLEAGKAYSYYQSGLLNATTRMTDAFVVEDPLTAEVDFANAQVRFVNAIHNSSPMVLYLKSVADANAPEIVVGEAVGYKSAGTFATVPNGSYDLRVRLPGSTTNLITRTAVVFDRARVYTISARGDMTVTAATPAPDRRPTLDNTIIR